MTMTIMHKHEGSEKLSFSKQVLLMFAHIWKNNKLRTTQWILVWKTLIWFLEWFWSCRGKPFVIVIVYVKHSSRSRNIFVCICICMKFLRPSWGELWLGAGRRHYLSNLAEHSLMPLCAVLLYTLHNYIQANTQYTSTGLTWHRTALCIVSFYGAF